MPDDKTLGGVLRAQAMSRGAETFLVCGTRRLTFAEADACADRIASFLLARGVVHGSRVALALPNTAEFPLFWVACSRIGALVVPVNTRYKAAEMKDVLLRSRCDTLVMVTVFQGIDYAAAIRSIAEGFDPSAQIQSLSDFPDLKRVFAFEEADLFGEILATLPHETVPSHALEAAQANVTSETPLIVVYTSGTSGPPKGVVHDHSILLNCDNIAREMHIDAGSIVLGHMPFYHVAGIFAVICTSILKGCTVIVVKQWTAAGVLNQVIAENVTVFGGIPTHYIDLTTAVSETGRRPTTIRTAWIGGASIDPQLVHRAKDLLNIPGLQSIYGMTETTSTTTLSRIDDPIEVVCENKGRVIGDFEVIVVDPETGAEVPTGEQGEIRVRGHVVMKGYLDDPDATAKAMTADGFLLTGDLGRYDENGFLQVTGRLKDIFRVGGSTVSPAEVEGVMRQHPAVQEAVVVGVPDARLGEVGFAFVMLERDASVDTDTLREFCKERLANYKVPLRVETVSQFPLTSTNKILRGELAARACAALEATD